MAFHRALLAVALLCACARNGNDSTLHSSADETSYALRYPELTTGVQKRTHDDAEHAREIIAAVARIQELKASDPVLAERVVLEADAAGNSESYAEARRDERSINALWSEERAGVGTRVNSAVQKDLADGGCGEKDLSPTIQHALKDSLDRPLERRLRASNEAQRTLELHKARFAGNLPAWQRAADDVAAARHYAYVALPEDAQMLERLRDEQRTVDGTLARAIDDERKIQADPRGGEQKASQDRVVQIEKARDAAAVAAEQAGKAAEQARAAAAKAQEEYERALRGVRDYLRKSPVPQSSQTAHAPSTSAGRAVKQ